MHGVSRRIAGVVLVDPDATHCPGDALARLRPAGDRVGRQDFLKDRVIVRLDRREETTDRLAALRVKRGSVIGSSCVSGCNGDAGCAELLLASQSGAALLVGDAFGTRGSSQPWAREVMADRRSDRNCRGDLNVSASSPAPDRRQRSPVPERQLEGHQPGRSGITSATLKITQGGQTIFGPVDYDNPDN